MTKKENFVAIKSALNEIGVQSYDEFIDHEIELLSRKRSTGKPTKNQRENEAIMETMMGIFETAETPLRASDVMKLMDEDYSLPKVSALLKKLVDSGKVNKTVEKKVSYFSIA